MCIELMTVKLLCISVSLGLHPAVAENYDCGCCVCAVFRGLHEWCISEFHKVHMSMCIDIRGARQQLIAKYHYRPRYQVHYVKQAFYNSWRSVGAGVLHHTHDYFACMVRFTPGGNNTITRLVCDEGKPAQHGWYLTDQR